MNSFINLSAIQSKGFNETIFKNAKQLKKKTLWNTTIITSHKIYKLESK